MSAEIEKRDLFAEAWEQVNRVSAAQAKVIQCAKDVCGSHPDTTFSKRRLLSHALREAVRELELEEARL